MPEALIAREVYYAIKRQGELVNCLDTQKGIRGQQYVSLLLSKTMRENGIRPSMGSVSSPWDNAAMESLMGIVKSECVHARTYATREEAALDLFEYIEVVYNRARIHSALGYLSPAEFEEANWPKENSRSKAA